MNGKNIKLIAPVAGIALLAIGFVSGMQIQKLTAKTSTQAGLSQAGGPGGGGRMMGGGRMNGSRPTFGTVTAVDGNDITISDSQSGATTKITLSSSTKVTDDSNASASASDIKTGDTVVVFGKAGSDGTVAATQVRLNPNMGSGAGNAQNQNSSSTTLN